jgi:hypothetical protein
MRKQYQIDDYIAAVEELASRHGLTVRPYNGKNNAIGFRVFASPTSTEPIELWVVHTTHGRWKSRKIWSSEDLKKPAQHIAHATQEEFEEILESI